MAQELIKLNDLYRLMCRGKAGFEQDKKDGIRDLTPINIPSYHALYLFIENISNFLEDSFPLNDEKTFSIDLLTGDLIPLEEDS